MIDPLDEHWFEGLPPAQVVHQHATTHPFPAMVGASLWLLRRAPPSVLVPAGTVPMIIPLYLIGGGLVAMPEEIAQMAPWANDPSQAFYTAVDCNGVPLYSRPVLAELDRKLSDITVQDLADIFGMADIRGTQLLRRQERIERAKVRESLLALFADVEHLRHINQPLRFASPDAFAQAARDLCDTFATQPAKELLLSFAWVVPPPPKPPGEVN